jgi:hypothetical protein
VWQGDSVMNNASIVVPLVWQNDSVMNNASIVVPLVCGRVIV